MVVVLALGGGALAFAGPGGFVFSAPPGWVDISRDAPTAQRKKAPPAMLAVADGHAFYAADLDGGGDGFMENMNAFVQTGLRPPVVTLAEMDEIETVTRAELFNQGFRIARPRRSWCSWAASRLAGWWLTRVPRRGRSACFNMQFRATGRTRC